MMWYLAIGALDSFGLDYYAVRHEPSWQGMLKARMFVFVGNTIFWLPINLYIFSMRAFKK